MFHLTPQEKSVLSGLLTVCLLGALIHCALVRNFQPAQWINTTAQKIKPHPPDINAATAQALDKVPGIGPKTAQHIIDYRARHGPFTSVYELRNIKGITKKNLQKIQKYYAEAKTQ